MAHMMTLLEQDLRVFWNQVGVKRRGMRLAASVAALAEQGVPSRVPAPPMLRTARLDIDRQV